MDEKDFVFINRSLSKKEEDAFSDFLQNKKNKKIIDKKSKKQIKFSEA